MTEDTYQNDERAFLVVGWYDDESERFADEYVTHGPHAAESEAKLEHPGLNVAGVVELVDGAMIVVA